MANNELIYICEICQTVLEEHHCKAVCPNCGRMFDCSDLPLIPANAMIDAGTSEVVPRPGSDPRDVLPKQREDQLPPVPPPNTNVANLP